MLLRKIRGGRINKIKLIPIFILFVVVSVFAVTETLNVSDEVDLVESIVDISDTDDTKAEEIISKSESLSKLGIQYWDMESEFGFTTDEVRQVKAELLDHRLSNLEKVELAEIEFGYDYNVEMKENFLEWNKNYSEIRFEEINSSSNQILIVGNKMDNIKGYKINGKGYAIELLACNRERNSCSFRINGIPTKRIYQEDMNEEPTSFNLGNGFELSIESIEFDKCDFKICDLFYDGYDAVEIEVLKK